MDLRGDRTEPGRARRRSKLPASNSSCHGGIGSNAYGLVAGSAGIVPLPAGSGAAAASVSRSSVSSICHARAPPAAERVGDGVGVDRRGGLHMSRRTRSGEQVLHRHRSARRRARPARRGRPAGGSAAAGSRSAHAVHRRRTVAGLAVQRQLGRRGAARPALSAPNQVLGQLAVGPAAEDRAGRRSSLSVGGSACDGGDDRRVGQHPAGGDVAAAGQHVARLPQRPQHGELRGGCAARACRRCGATGRPAAPAGRRRGPRSNSCRRPLGLALLVQDRGERVAQLDQHLDVQGGVDQPVVGQRPGGPVGGRVALLQARTRAATRRPRRGPPGGGRPAGRRARCRTAAPGTSPISARQGRSWLAACSTHSASAIASWSTDRSGSGTGSISPVPRPVAAELHQVGALAVAVARRALGVDGDRAAAGARAPRRTRPAASRSRPPAAVRRGVRGAAWRAGRHPPPRRPRRPHAAGARPRRRPTGEWARCSVAVHLLAGRVVGPAGIRPGPRGRAAPGQGRASSGSRADARLPVTMFGGLGAGAVGGPRRWTPGGGRPAALPSTCSHASRCRSSSVSSAVQDARISTSTRCSGPARSPKRVEAVRVTVPPTAWWAAPVSISASVSQLHATSENIGSSTSCSSVPAET